MSIVLFILGIPLITFLLLYRNRRQLHHPNVIAQYGDLYKKYDDRWYWWEPILMLQKCMLTGAMCAIAPGSAVQLLVASLVSLGYLLLILKAEPYVGILEDRLAFMTQLALTVSLILGLCLIMDDPSNPTFNKDIMGVVLVCLNILPFLYLIYACIQLMRKGSSAGIHIVNNVVHVVPRTMQPPLSLPASVVGSSEITKVFDPSDNFLSRTKTFALVKKAVDHDKVLKIQDIHRASKNRLEKRIKEQESRADARVRKRLSNKRKKKSAQKQLTKVRQVEPVADYTLEIQTFRSKLASATQTPEKLIVLFNKLDKNKDSTLSKKEFSKVAAAVIKPKSKKTFEKVFNAVWADARQLRKQGRGIDELDFDTLRSWTFGYRPVGVAQKTTA